MFQQPEAEHFRAQSTVSLKNYSYGTQPTHDIRTMLYVRCFNVLTSFRRPYDFILTLWASWESNTYPIFFETLSSVRVLVFVKDSKLFHVKTSVSAVSSLNSDSLDVVLTVQSNLCFEKKKKESRNSETK